MSSVVGRPPGVGHDAADRPESHPTDRRTAESTDHPRRAPPLTTARSSHVLRADASLADRGPVRFQQCADLDDGATDR
ncbi:hypothetical protein [Streptomyces sp. SP17KL33]|uniref:hypothetical protein n=1 Tax=Streptomyces sp. SP17KL33 TaxID=3002534 RepID=UPI002E76A7E4|nr:hypothetical protein [Streptomyces sp. SP17KL33]MEE1837849.1 hypothetical protein [Streptomyces sp. SP17KL33]